MMHGPNGMEADFLNNLTRVSSLGPDLINDFAAAPKVSSHSSYLNDDFFTPFSMSVNVSGARIYIIHGPDVVEPVPPATSILARTLLNRTVQLLTSSTALTLPSGTDRPYPHPG